MILNVLVETTQATDELDAAITAALGYTSEMIVINDDLFDIPFDDQVQCRVERQFFTGDITHMLTVFFVGATPPAVETDIMLAQALAQHSNARVYAERESDRFPDDFVRVLASGELQPVEIDQSDDGLRFTLREGIPA